jgi:type VI secretion system secreted protein Hcp
MAFTCIIKIDGIDGSSQIKDKWIDVLSFRWGVTQTRKAWENNPSGTGTVQDFSIVKRIDPASPDLFTKCAFGEKINKVEVLLMHASGKEPPKEYAKYEFNDAYISNVRPGGGARSEFPEEEVWFNFAKANYSYGSKKGNFDVGKAGIKGA